MIKRKIKKNNGTSRFFGWLFLLQFFDGDPHPVSCFEDMALGNVYVEPEGVWVVLGGILRHQAVFLVVDVRDKFYLGL